MDVDYVLVNVNQMGAGNTRSATNQMFARSHYGLVLVVALLRIAYTLLALFRSVTQRSDERRAVPWKTVMSEIFFALVTTTDYELREL
ncbi:MAG TPA: hypothetical protein VJN18_06070, partial [Polyangiaceae bacterium]|nr:hypothetical protein [Polyangiaceae bacterium]